MENRKFIVVYKDPMCFEAHPLNKEIYGTEEIDPDFKEDIQDNGIREPIVVNKAGYIISGHRRWRAAIAVGLHDIPVRLEEYPNKESEELALIGYNNQRVKSKSQIVEEVKLLRKIFKELGIERRLKNLKPFSESEITENISDVFEENDATSKNIVDASDKGLEYLGYLQKTASNPGSSSEKIAKVTGTSKASVERISSVIDASEDEDPEVSGPAKDRLEEMKAGNLGFSTAAKMTREDRRKPKGQRGRPKGATSGPISTTGVKTLIQTNLADYTPEKKGVEILREWLVEQAREKSLEAKKLAIRRGSKRITEADFRRVLDKPAY